MRTIVWFLCLLSLNAWAQEKSAPLTLKLGIHLIQAEVANTAAARSQGLMHRKSLKGNHGMLFVFENSDRHCMWMKNTLIPLSVAFINEQGEIVNIEDMLPQTESPHCASQPAKFALEMNQGWFQSKGMQVGFRIQDLKKAPQGLP